MTTQFRALLFLAFIPFVLIAQTPGPTIGSPAPRIAIAEFITGDATSATPKGKNIVLEFWATWCAPCIGAIPHLNELSEKFSDRNVAFLSISAEDRSVVSKFLKNHAMKSYVVLDSLRATHKAYGIEGIPQTFLIDSKGVLRWHGNPTTLTEEALSAFLETDVISLKPSRSIFSIPTDDQNSLIFLSVTPSERVSNPAGSMLSRQHGDTTEILLRGGTVTGFVSRLLGIPETRITTEGEMPDFPIDLTIRSSWGLSDSLLRVRALESISDVFRMARTIETQKRTGWVLSVSNSNLLTPSSARKGSSSTMFSKSGWIGNNVSPGVLVTAMESSFKQLFFDETGLTTRHDFEVPIGDIDSLRTSLQTRYGLTIIKAERSVEITHLRVSKRSE